MCVIDKILFDYKNIRLRPSDCLTALYLPAMNKLNSIMDEADTPEATATCIILSSYCLQKWADNARKNIEVFEENNKTLGTVEEVHKLLVDIYDVPSKMNFPEHTKSLLLTKELLETVESAIIEISKYPNTGRKMFNVMDKLHLNLDLADSSVSKYNINKWYKPAVELIIERFGERFSEVFEEITLKNTERDEEKQLAYHNTVLLLEAYSIFKWNVSAKKDINNMNTAEANSLTKQLLVIKLIDEAIKEIKNYPVEGHLCADVLESIITDKKPEDVWKEHNVSRSFYYRARKKGILLLSYLIWGYTTRDILNLAI